MGGSSVGKDERRYKIQTVSQSQEGAQATAAITCLRLGHTTLSAHLNRLHLSPDHFCPWCRTTPEAMKHFLLQCHASTLTTLRYTHGSPLWPSQHSTYPPSWQLLVSTRPSNLLSFALLVPS
ncbi:hypothetical protein E2C01_075135 [Portunus trituberculatus]|uniref:Reverse transcriptase zinc-binding domain-containing protein n=1 Tax=Portunus trituberculatus TaxID=210409 RepID=A0A5B7IEA4_PORTR|nr:hypothetical protein [Portunus trituberculatus]